VKRSAALTVSLIFVLHASFDCRAKAVPPNSQQAPPVLPTVKRDTLLNGLQLIVLEQPGSNTVVAHLRINSGAMFDLAGKGGLADLTAALLQKDGGLIARGVSESVEQPGLTLNTRVGWDSTDLVISGAPDAIEAIFELLGKLIISPAFDAKELENVKAERIQMLKTQPIADSELVRDKALQALFGTHPYGHRLMGSPESVAQISRQDLISYHSRFYLANNAELAISGEVTAEDVTRRARAKLGGWKKGDRVPATFRPPEIPQTPKVFVLDRAEGAPGIACIAQLGPSRRSQDYFAAVIAADLLAQSNSKLAEASAVTVETLFELRYLEGPLTIVIKGPQPAVKTAVGELVANLSKFSSTQPPLDAVEAARSRMIAAFAERLRTPQTTLDLLLDVELYGLGRDYLMSFIDRVNAVGPADVMRAAQSYLKPQSVAVVVAGPAGALEAPLKKLGAITVLK
jgi:zinc protease